MSATSDPMYSNQPAVSTTMENTGISSMLEDMSRQMASSRLSRRSSGRQPANTYNIYGRTPTRSNRIMKSTSVSSSPSPLDPRRPLPSDSRPRRPPTMSAYYGSDYPLLRQDTRPWPVTSTRPLTWHPTSQQAGSPTRGAMADAMVGLDGPLFPAQFATMDLLDQTPFYGPPTPSLHPCSDGMSPVASISPLAAPYYEFEDPQPLQLASIGTHFPPEQGASNDIPSTFTPMANQQSAQPTDLGSFHAPLTETQGLIDMSSQWQTYPAIPYVSPGEGLLWDHFPAVNGIANPSAPVESFDAESGSLMDPPTKELVGMGLYDAPENNSAPDVRLQSYRKQMIENLMGSGYTNSTAGGRGLKLEETWKPPPSPKSGDDEQGELSDNEDEEEEAEEPPAEHNEHNEHEATSQIAVPLSETSFLFEEDAEGEFEEKGAYVYGEGSYSFVPSGMGQGDGMHGWL